MTIQEAIAKYGENEDTTLVFAILFILQNYVSASNEQLANAVSLLSFLSTIALSKLLSDATTVSESITVARV